LSSSRRNGVRFDLSDRNLRCLQISLVLFGQSYDDPGKERKMVNTMQKERVDGLIISLSKQTNQYAHPEALEKYNIPVV